ncbi:hypothetical protein [Streptomyces sp. NBC_01264]|uniref:hypothetical protein n=1 Tax=Streptomyces sp. NBC_01264 TaxID=2903804 RepID=UPI00224E3C3A|nr:hypothetical protein [Streptomyces sp. NBC_01264]MCX4776144.1 hypothetical protein [Streptomyces sp. NBC_01264]
MIVGEGFGTLVAAAEGCDVGPTNGMRAAAGARGAADRWGIPCVYACYHVRGLPPRKVTPQASGQSEKDAVAKAHWPSRHTTSVWASGSRHGPGELHRPACRDCVRPGYMDAASDGAPPVHR